MADLGWNPNLAIAEMARLISPGVLGFYTQFETTEIFAIQDGQSTPVNVFSILVAEDRPDTPPQAARYLNPSRIRLKKLRGWSFGIRQYCRPIAELTQSLEDFIKTGTWKPSGETLDVGKLVSVPPQFVPPDSIDEVPWNRVLKNNFWNGSHLLEWSDQKKTALKPLFDDPRRLQELSDCVRRCVPIGLARLSDRLGNIVIQLPVTVMIANFTGLRDSSDFVVKVAWDQKTTPRPLRATCEMEFDGIVSGYASSSIDAQETRLPMLPGHGLHRGVVWDDLHQVILAATGPSGFIRAVPFNINIANPEPRVFTVRNLDGSATLVRVPVTSKTEGMAGYPKVDDNGGWTQRRIYANEVFQLAVERRFVQYRPVANQQQIEREKALQDIRALINQYGESGAWLWDPYLRAQDILDTLFHCGHFNVDLRALTAAQEFEPCGAPEASVSLGDTSSRGRTSGTTFADRQRVEPVMNFIPGKNFFASMDEQSRSMEGWGSSIRRAIRAM